MSYYLDHYLDGMDQWQAYEHFDLDMVIYHGPSASFTEKQKAEWWSESTPKIDCGNETLSWTTTFHTPEGDLTADYQSNPITSWVVKPQIVTEADWELHEKYAPVPTLDWRPVEEVKKRLGERGIVRCGVFGFGQGSPWQDLCCLMDTVPAIMAAKDNPEWVHHMLSVILEKRLEALEKGGEIAADLVESGGGAGSNTVISPDMQQEFCLPYDVKQHRALHDKGTKIVYHLCGGLMKSFDLVVNNGTDGLETMTPDEMGGDCVLTDASSEVGDKLFFIGGFDQYAGLENGTPETASQLVHECHDACPDGGYICCPSDRF